MQAMLLGQGAKFGVKKSRTRMMREVPSVDITMEGKVYREEVPIRYANTLGNVNIGTVFNGIKSLFDLQNVIFGSLSDPWDCPVIVDASTG